MAFALPGALATIALAWAYVADGGLEHGGLAHIEPFLRGVRPAVLGILFAAAWRLGRTAITGWPLAAIGAAVAAASLAGLNQIGALLAGAVFGALLLRFTRPRPRLPAKPAAGLLAGCAAAAAARPAAAAPILATTCGAACAAVGAIPLWQIGLYFLQIGAVLYGGGYVLVAYLQGGLVDHGGPLPQQQLLDAVAAGQLTPGPLITTATFVGFLLCPEWPVAGAATATLAIMLPGFFLVAATNPWIPRLRRWPWTARLLDALGAASVGLMAAVIVALARATLHVPPIDWPQWQNWLIVPGCAAVFLIWRVPAAWIVLLGAALGYLGQIAERAF